MAYRRDDIERVRAATDLVDLVAEVTKIRRSGRSVMAVCPFHQEKTPSMSVDPGRGLYHCFGCGKSGDLFRFVQETQALDFTDALELLARRSGITLHRDPEAAKQRSRREALVAAVSEAVDFYLERLKTAPDAASARKYLRSREYDTATVDTFSLGYSPDQGETLIRHLRDKSIPDDASVAAGLAMRNRTGRLYDRFRGRVMFPIFDVRGDPVGFGARILDGDGPKYLNSPETPLYRKSGLLYGLNWAKSEVVRSNTVVVVEGYTDVIALHKAGMPIAVATCGTALGEEHLDILRRFTERVVLMFDADEAGIGASLRGFERSVPGDLDMRVASLPMGRDPADVVADGEVAAVQNAIDVSVPLLEFRVNKELDGFNLEEREGRSRAMRAAAALVARHPDPVVRQAYLGHISRGTAIPESDVAKAVDVAIAAQRREGKESERSTDAVSGSQPPVERDLLRLVLDNSQAVRGIGIDEHWFTDPMLKAGFAHVASNIAAMPRGQRPDLGALLGDDESDIGAALRSLAMDVRPLEDEEVVVRTAQYEMIEREISRSRLEIASLERDGKSQEASDRLEQLIGLERRRIELRRPD
ncbi:DNA primase [bacterium]|nr:DNA primase [bacterium]